MHRHIPQTLALFAATVLMSGCADLLQRPAPELAGTMRSAPAELPAWWEALGNPGLNRAVSTALADNPEIEALEARIREARELAGAQRARGLPAVDVNAGWQEGRRNDLASGFKNIEIDPWRGAGSVSWEIDWFGRIAARTRAARFNVAQRLADRHGGRVLVSAETASAYLTALRLNEELQIVREIERASTGIADNLRNREMAGLASSAETARQEAETENLHRITLELARQRDAATTRLDSLQGQTPGSLPAVESTLSSATRIPSLPTEIPASLVRNRPDLLAAEAAVRSAHALEEAERLDLYPNIQLRFDGLATANALTGPLASWLTAAGPRLNLQALDPQAHAEARAARPRTDAAYAQWKRTLLDAFAELETAAADFHSHRKQLDSAQTEAWKLRIAWEQTRRNFQAGLVSQLEVLEDQRRYLAARRAKLAAHHNVLLDYVAMMKATGGGMP